MARKLPESGSEHHGFSTPDAPQPQKTHTAEHESAGNGFAVACDLTFEKIILMPRAYIETTVPSYYVARTSLNLLQASRQASTRLWWDSGCSGFELFTSLEAIEEAQEGEAEMAQLRLALLRQATRLDIADEVGSLAQKLVSSGLIPDKAASDAIHIAVASVHRMDYLVTWNFKHIANPFMRDRLRKTVHEAGFHLPVLCSPDELLQYNEDD